MLRSYMHNLHLNHLLYTFKIKSWNVWKTSYSKTSREQASEHAAYYILRKVVLCVLLNLFSISEINIVYNTPAQRIQFKNKESNVTFTALPCYSGNINMSYIHIPYSEQCNQLTWEYANAHVRKHNFHFKNISLKIN